MSDNRQPQPVRFIDCGRNLSRAECRVQLDHVDSGGRLPAHFDDDFLGRHPRVVQLFVAGDDARST